MAAPALTLRVLSRTVEAEGICGFELASPDGAALPPFTAGAHLDVHLPGGLTRQYSLCSDPADTHRYRIAVLREAASRGGSAAMHEQVHAGGLLATSLPRNSFPLADGATRHLLLAGGIGVTPLLSMARHLARTGADFHLHYATRSAARTAFAAELAAVPWAQRVSVHHDDGAPAQRLDLPRVLAAPGAGHHLYVCGPTGFIDAVRAEARAQGWPDARVHVEFFGAAPVVAAEGGGFEVMLARTGRVVPVPADRTVVQALAAAGVAVPTSCEQGVCGTCLTRVIDGQPDHRDLYLTPEEQAAGDQFLPCCSRAKSPRLVLDL
jgi:vanillate monooxygenase ferredoxin subunit